MSPMTFGKTALMSCFKRTPSWVTSPIRPAGACPNPATGPTMTPIDRQFLVERAMQIVTLDADGINSTSRENVATIMSEFGVTKLRANTAVAQACRRLRNKQLVNDSGPATFMLRVRLTERQRERLQLMADRETGGDMSDLVRRRLFE